MADRSVTRRSKRLSWLLRHGAKETELEMDGAGWCSVEEVLAALSITRDQLEEAVRLNTKSRLELHGSRVRACQGHSTDGTPVTADALEASWDELEGDDRLWHGTFIEAVQPIAEKGILPQARTHVHLTREWESKVGKRANVHVGLAIDPVRVRSAGIGIYVAPNGVVLARAIPAEAIVDIVAVTKRARAAEPDLRALLFGEGL